MDRVQSWTWQSVMASALIGGILVSGPAGAQEKHHFSFQGMPENTKYVQQHVIDVDDMPNHQVRIFEIRRTYPKGAASFDGVDVVEDWSRGYSDYTGGSGRNWGYESWTLENGDKIFGRFEATSHKRTSDGSASASGISVITLTGGTGRFAKIRGTVFGSFTFDQQRGINATKIEGDYWMEP